MSLTVIAVALVLLLFFLFLNPANKAMMSLIISSNAFDLAPKVIFGRDIWDIGIVMFLITALHLTFCKKKLTIERPLYLYLIYAFIAWMLVSLSWSILFFDYDISQTLKNSRHLILGYTLIFIFIKLFETDEKYFKLIVKYLYIATYALMIVVVIQYMSNKRIFYGLIIDYQGSIRALPIFLPFSMLLTWKILFGYISGRPIAIHEKIYTLLSFFVIATTYTRGIYLATVFGFMVMFYIALKQKKISPKRAIMFTVTGLFSISLLLLSGSMNKVIDRAASAASILSGGKTQQTAGGADTFSGRLNLTVERFELVLEHNPLVGYGFLHEDEVPASMRNKLRYGSILYSDYYRRLYRVGHHYVLALYSADIGWADLVVKTGFIGFGIFLIIIFLIISSVTKIFKFSGSDELNTWAVALYLQLFISTLLMFNGNPFVVNLQIPMFLIAGLMYCTNPKLMPSKTINIHK